MEIRGKKRIGNCYEYKKFYIDYIGYISKVHQSYKDINELADEGWELITAFSADVYVFGYFKRLHNSNIANGIDLTENKK